MYCAALKHPFRLLTLVPGGAAPPASDFGSFRVELLRVYREGDLDLTPGPPSIFWLVMLGVTSQSAGYLLISVSLPRLPAIITSVILLCQPVMSMGLAMVLLGETPSSTQLLGVALVVGGITAATIPVARMRDGLQRLRSPSAA